MHLTLAQLEAFYWVARLGSVTRAAVHLNLAQPTISLRLRELERTLGAHLFERQGRSLRIADEGVALLDHADSILGEVARIRERLGGDDGVGGIVTMGVSETFALACLPRLIERLNCDYPALRLELIVGTSAELERELRQRRIDLCFLTDPSGEPGLQLFPLGVQECCWAAAPKLGLPPVIRPADLRGRLILTNSPPAPMHRQITGWFQAAGLEPMRLSICNSVTVIARLVAEGVAVGVLPAKLIEAEVAAGRIQVLQARPAVDHVRLHAAYRAGEGGRSAMAIITAARTILATLDFLKTS